MNETGWHLLAFVPALVLIWVALSLSRINAQLRNAEGANRWAFVALMLALVAGGSFAWLALHAPPAPEPVAPVVQIDGLLAQCIRDGGVQMAYLGGRWSCITPDQAG